MTIQELITPSNSIKKLPYNLECGTLKSIGSRVKYNNKKQSIEVGKNYKNYYYYCNKAHLVMDTKLSEDTIKSFPNTETKNGFYFKANNDAYFGKYLLNNNNNNEAQQKCNGKNFYYNTNNNNYTTFTHDSYTFQRSETFSTTPVSSNESSIDINTNSSESSVINKVFDMYIQSFVIQDYADAEKIFHYNKRMIAKNLARSYKKLH